MKPSEVITADSQKRGLDPNLVVRGVHDIVKKGGLVLHNGNTSLVLQKLGQGVYASHLFTHDSPLALAKALMTFFRQMQGKGIHRIYGKADNQAIVDLMKQLGQRENVRVEPSDLPRYNWMIEL